MLPYLNWLISIYRHKVLITYTDDTIKCQVCMFISHARVSGMHL